MIPQSDLDRALARWKSRQRAGDRPAPTAAEGAFGEEMNATSSGIISLAEAGAEVDTPIPET